MSMHKGLLVGPVVIGVLAALGSAPPASAQQPSPPIVVASEWGTPGALVRATCPAGTQLIGGGHDAQLVVNLLDQVVDDIELNAPDGWNPNTWHARAHLGQARAFAMCTAQAPTPTVVASQWGATAAVARATCPAGTHLIGGGHDARLVVNIASQVMDAMELNAPDPSVADT